MVADKFESCRPTLSSAASTSGKIAFDTVPTTNQPPLPITSNPCKQNNGRHFNRHLRPASSWRKLSLPHTDRSDRHNKPTNALAEIKRNAQGRNFIFYDYFDIHNSVTLICHKLRGLNVLCKNDHDLWLLRNRSVHHLYLSLFPCFLSSRCKLFFLYYLFTAPRRIISVFNHRK